MEVMEVREVSSQSYLSLGPSQGSEGASMLAVKIDSAVLGFTACVLPTAFWRLYYKILFRWFMFFLIFMSKTLRNR